MSKVAAVLGHCWVRTSDQSLLAKSRIRSSSLILYFQAFGFLLDASIFGKQAIAMSWSVMELLHIMPLGFGLLLMNMWSIHDLPLVGLVMTGSRECEAIKHK